MRSSKEEQTSPNYHYNDLLIYFLEYRALCLLSMGHLRTIYYARTCAHDIWYFTHKSLSLCSYTYLHWILFYKCLYLIKYLWTIAKCSVMLSSDRPLPSLVPLDHNLTFCPTTKYSVYGCCIKVSSIFYLHLWLEIVN